MIAPGHSYTLTVTKLVDFGAYLDAGEMGEVLLPRKFNPAGLAAGDALKVFLYLDSEDRPVATTQQPKAEVGEFAYLSVVAISNIGAFLDWGLEKDILVPFAEQHRPMEVGRSYLVYLYLDRRDGRIVASSKIDKFVDDQDPYDFEVGQPVELIIANSTDLGFKAIIDHRHWGVLYANEVYQRLNFGQSINGYIKHIRDDGKIDLSLKPAHDPADSRDHDASIVLDYLDRHDGHSPLHDKSDPKLIAEQMGMSKAAFKRAIGRLYKRRLIRIDKDGIQLLER